MTKTGKNSSEIPKLIAILLLLTMMILYFNLSTVVPPPLGIPCISQSGYVCENPLFHNNTFSVILGQETGTNWKRTDFIFVPQGTSQPITMPACPAPYSNTSTSGLSCAAPKSINVINGNTTTETFTFSHPVISGTVYSGVIFAEYLDNTTENWQIVQLAKVSAKAV